MARPKLKAEERFEQLLRRIHSGERLDPWTYREIAAECSGNSSFLTQVVLALADIASGDIEKGLLVIEQLLPRGDAHFARLFCRLQERFGRLEKLDSYIYELADKFPGKWLNFKAGGVAYLVGRLSKCQDYLERHCKMLSEDEQRKVCEFFRQEAIDDMVSAYESSGCTFEQYREVAFAVSRILAQHPPGKYKTNINGNAGGSYIVEIIGASPEEISAMNMALADEICRIDLLDDCNLIARFSVERVISKGVDYAYD